MESKYAKSFYPQFFSQIEHKSLILQPKYYPKKDFIEFHLDSIFRC